jgi:hypothetical protein
VSYALNLIETARISIAWPLLAWIILIATVVAVALTTKVAERRRTALTILRLLLPRRR